jgi:hypothetical protein
MVSVSGNMSGNNNNDNDNHPNNGGNGINSNNYLYYQQQQNNNINHAVTPNITHKSKENNRTSSYSESIMSNLKTIIHQNDMRLHNKNSNVIFEDDGSSTTYNDSYLKNHNNNNNYLSTVQQIKNQQVKTPIIAKPNLHHNVPLKSQTHTGHSITSQVPIHNMK